MEKKFDVKNTKEVIVLVLKSGEAVKKSLEDGKMDVADTANFFPIISLIQPALEGISLIPSEIKDLDAEEAQELIDLVAKDIGVLANAPKLVSQINAALKLVKAANEFYLTVKSGEAA